jgi:DNA-binding MarR family transcriptional regulator
METRILSPSDIFRIVTTEPDHVGVVMAQWSRERPDLDVSPQGVIGRLHRVGARLTEELVAVYDEFGLGEGEFDVLATLRRSGAPYELTPGALAAGTMVTSGAITKRVDRCVQQGWVTRRVSEHDGRGRVIALTPAGRELMDRAFEAHIANEHRLVGLLPAADRAALARILESWARSLDP